MSFSLTRVRACGALCVAALLVFASPASASHIKGGSVSAAIDAGQHLTGHVEFIYREVGACPAAPGQLAGATVQVDGPGGFTATPTLTNVVMAACLPSTKTEGGDFDVDLSGAPDGTYTVTYSNCCRVTPIANVSGGAAGNTSFTATIHKAGSTVSTTPSLTSNVALGVSTHAAYDQNLNATGSAPLTYLLLQSAASAQPDYDATAPTSNIVAIDGSGRVSIPAGTTSGLAPGAAYVYKVRVVDAAGNSAEREVLLTVSTNNVPVLAGAQGPVDVTAGATTTVQFTATDADSSQSVAIRPSGLPAWATVSPADGNPAAATLTLSPPAGTPPQDITVNVDASDDDATAPMTDSRTLTLRVSAPAAPQPTATPTPPATPAAPPAKAPAVAVLAPDAIVTAGGRASVRCGVNGDALTSCTVRVYVHTTGRHGKPALVRIGTGRTGAVAAGSSARVRLTLTARGRRLLSRVGGVKAELRITARGSSGKTLRASDLTRLLPAHARVVTAAGVFSSGSAVLSRSGRRAVDRLARRLDRVKTAVCTGYTDGVGNARANERLALARAKAVCAALRARHPKLAVRTRSAGESRPLASNRTAAGRAQNRRVAVGLGY